MDKTTKWILELVDRVTGPLQRIAKQAGAAYASADKLTERLDVLQERSGRLSSSLRSIGIGVAAFTALSYGSLQFDKAMAMTNTMAKKTGNELAVMKNQVRGLAAEIPVARDELANGLYNVISSGVPENNWIQFLEDSTKGAIGGGAELGVVITATAGMIKNYGLEWDQAVAIQDKFQNTVDKGMIPGLEALASALPRVAGSANALGVDMDELMASFATFTGVTGPTTNEISTQMQALFTSLMKPTAEATKLSNEMGIMWNANAIKAAGGLNNFIQSISPKIDAYAAQTGKTKEQIIGLLTGSAEAMKPVLALTTELSSQFVANTTSMANSSGMAAAAYANATDHMLAKVQQFRNQFSGMIDRVVEAVGPFVSALVTMLSYLISIGGWFMDTFPVFSGFMIAFVTGATILTTFGLIIGFIITQLQIYQTRLALAALSQNTLTGAIARTVIGLGVQAMSLFRNIGAFIVAGTVAIATFVAGLVGATAAQWLLNIAMNANPLGLIVLGIAAVIGALTLLYVYWDEIVAVFLKVGKFFLKWNPFTWVFSLIYTLFPEVRAWVDNVFDSIMQYIEKVWGFIKGIVEKVKGWFGGKVDVDVNTPDPDVKDPNAPPQMPGQDSDFVMPDLSGSGGTGSGGTPTAEGTGSGGKIITMNLDIKNAFNVSGAADIEDIAEQLTARIVGRLRDGMIALG